MKKLLLFVLVFALLAGYALMAMGSEESENNSSSTKTEEATGAGKTKLSNDTTNFGETTELNTQQIQPSAERLEYSKRAAVTAMTNYCAFDGKIHSYSDKSGDLPLYYMFVISWGSWTLNGDGSYHVTDLQTRTYGREDGSTGEYSDWESIAYKFSLDVKYDPKENVYTISHVYSAYKEKGDASFTSMPYIDSHELFSIPFSLVEKDRT